MNCDVGITHLDDLTRRIIACIIRVHQTLGPGFLEKVYRRSLLIALRKDAIPVEHEKVILVHYEGHRVGRHRLDLLVDSRVVLELKTVACLSKAHYAQVRSYLKASGAPLGLLVNFAGHAADFRRILPP